jgi:hypothetical protein
MIEEFKLSKTISFLVRSAILFFFSIFAILGFAQAERLYSFLYSIPYSSVKSEIDNPRTKKGLYPDTLNWSNGGGPKFGLQAHIWCNKTILQYLPTELVGVRAGLRNLSDSVIQLGFAYYSPNKHGIPPEYTLFIEGPYNYPRVIGYLGDDVLYGGPRTKLQNMTSIPPGKVFNTSPDSLFYNVSDGLFSFETPGTYRLWFSYSFDSFTSSLSTPLTSISSDTIELEVTKPRFVDAKRLANFLPRRLDGFKSGKPKIHSRLLNPHWTESLQYPSAWKYYFQVKDDFAWPHIGVFIVDSGGLPAILARWYSPGMVAESSETTIKGFPACKHHQTPNQEGPSIEVICVMVANSIVVRICGSGVQMEELEYAARAVDYAAIAQALER